MTEHKGEVVVGVFHDRGQARGAIEALQDAGFATGDLSILMPNAEDPQAVAEETEATAEAGAATGAVAGGLVGGIAGILGGLSTLAIPVVGPFLAAGALAAALASAAIGAGVGAIAGALLSMGVPKDDAEWYEREVHSGGTLVTIRADGRYAEAQGILRLYGAYDVETLDAGAVGQDAAGGAGSGAQPTATAAAGAARRPDAPRWEDHLPRYRTAWEQREETIRGRWEEYEPLYRYGWERASEPRYRGRSWAEAEPELRRDWESHHPEMPWDRVADSVRDAWQEVADAAKTSPEGGGAS